MYENINNNLLILFIFKYLIFFSQIFEIYEYKKLNTGIQEKKININSG